jgi:hypothetical protein
VPTRLVLFRELAKVELEITPRESPGG